MNSRTRSANSIRNLLVGLISQIVIILLMFVSRTFFIKILGAEYLGLQGLYTNILTVLSLAELGIGNVMIYVLYKPVAEKDEGKIRAILKFFKTVYHRIAFAILLIGIAVIPFLNSIVNSEIPFREVIILYLLFLFNSFISYFVIYKSALINADQKIYLENIIQTSVIVLREVGQIIVLIVTQSFLLYLVIMITGTLLNNLLISKTTDKLYPFLKLSGETSVVETKTIINNIKAIFFYKIGTVLMNHTDNILISVLLGTIFVGYYSNYNLLIMAVTTLVSVIIQGVSSSIGNLNASGNIKRSYELFNSLLLFFHWLSALCAVSFFLVFNDFIKLWIGDEYILSTIVVSAIVLNFYIQNIINPVWVYRETMGLFNRVKYLMLIAAVANILLSIFLGLLWGLAGIILATGLARILTTVWYEPMLLYRLKFSKPVKFYWMKQAKYFLLTAITFVVSLYLTQNFPLSLSFVFFKIFIGITVLSVVFYLANFKSDEYLLLKSFIKINVTKKILEAANKL